jgi:hypothetical protein
MTLVIKNSSFQSVLIEMKKFLQSNGIQYDVVAYEDNEKFCISFKISPEDYKIIGEEGFNKYSKNFNSRLNTAGCLFPVLIFTMFIGVLICIL